MEGDEIEDALDRFKVTIVQFLGDSAFLGKDITKKINRLLNKVYSNRDIQKLEAIGLELLSLFNTVKRNMSAIAESLEKNLENINENRSDKLFEDLYSKLLDYKMHTFMTESGNDNNKVPSDKNTQTDFSISDMDNNMSGGEKQVDINKEPDADAEITTQVNINKVSENNNASTLREVIQRQPSNLGLKKTDTQDTNDSWIDCMNREPSAMEVWNSRHKNEEIKTEDHIQDQDFEEEHDEHKQRPNQKNSDINSDTDSDDTFIDGCTPKEEMESVHESDGDNVSHVEKNETNAGSGIIKVEESIEEDNELLNIDTAPTSQKSVSSENLGTNMEDQNIIINTHSETEKPIEKINTKESTNYDLQTTKNNLDEDANIDMSEKCSKSKNMSLGLSNKIASGEMVTEERVNLEPNIHKTGTTDNILEAINSVLEDLNQTGAVNSIETEKLKTNTETKEESTHEEDTYRDPFSVETQILESDTEEVVSSHSAKNSDSEDIMATQPILNETINFNLHSNQDEPIVNNEELIESFSSSSTEELNEIDHFENASSSPNLEINEASSDMKQNNEIKKPNSEIDNITTHHSDENINIASDATIKQIDSNEENISDCHNSDKNIKAPSSLITSKNCEADSKQFPEASYTQQSGTFDLNLHKQSVGSPKPQSSITKNSVEGVVYHPCSLDLKDDNAVPNQLVVCPISQSSSTKNVCSDGDVDQSLKSPNPLSLTLEITDQVSDAKQLHESPIPKLPDTKKLNCDVNNKLSPSTPTSKSEAYKSEQSPNIQSSPLELINQESDVEQVLRSPSSQLSDACSNSDDRNLSQKCLASKIELSAAEKSLEPANSQLSGTNDASVDKDINGTLNFLASKNTTTNFLASTSDAENPSGSLNIQIPAFDVNDKASNAKESSESLNRELSSMEQLNPVKSVNLSSNEDASKSTSVLNRSLESAHTQSSGEKNINTESLSTTNKIDANKALDVKQSVDSVAETATQPEFNIEQELKAFRSSLLENSEADVEIGELEIPDSQKTEILPSNLDTSDTCTINKSLTKDNSQYDSDATDIDRDESESIKQIANFNTNDKSLKSTKVLVSDVEENFSQLSNKSFEFDISENLKSIDRNETESDNNTLKENKSEDINNETIEIVSDSDDDVHLDVTLEEILSDGSNVQEPELEEVDKKEDIVEIIPVKSPEFVSSNDNFSCNFKQNAIGDELLELLREVEVPSDLDIASREQEQMIKKEIKNADEIFELLQVETSLEITDSDLSEEDLNWDLDEESDLSENNSMEEMVIEDEKTEKCVKEFYIKQCYIPLERLELNKEDIVTVNKSLNDSIDRLCDINSIINKRKYVSPDLLQNSKRIKLKKRDKSTKSNASDSESFSDFSNTDSDNELGNDTPHCPILPAPLEQRLDDILANDICQALKSNSDHESTDDESDNSRNSSKKKKKKKEEDNENDKVSKPTLTKEEKQKKSWKNDPLLRGKLNSDSDTSTSSEKSTKRKKIRKTFEHGIELDIATDINTDSDDSVIYQQNKAWLKEKLISPIKENIPDSSDSDDCEFVPQQKASPQKDHDVNDNEAGPSNTQKGRRNIRALMSDESLTEATQRANKEEQERIERLEERSRVMESFSQSLSQSYEEEDTLILDVDEKLGEPLITVHQKLCRKLKPHQKLGIKFMWDSCYESVERLKEHDEGSGCILAHCMGLGKTLQVLTLIHTLFSHDVTNTKHVLVVCPLSTVNNWKNEVKIAFNGMPEAIRILTIADKKETSKKYDIVKKYKLRSKCVLILGYECFETLINESKLDKAGPYLKSRMLEALVDPGPDLVICDEGHLLRNKKALKTMALNMIKTKRRIVLTGTPLQNNLNEYYYMVQFVKPNLLGNMKEYKTNFVNPITNGQYEDSTKEDIKLMMKRTHVLHKLLKKTIQRIEDTELQMYLPKMVDHAVFIQLHQVQVELYNKFSEIIKDSTAKTTKKGFLSDFNVFQYIGTHPQLLAVVESMKNKRIKERDLITDEQEENTICNIDGWWKSKMPEDAAEKIYYGNKLVVVKAILEECEEIGDKLLIFSQSLGEMDLIEHFLKKVGTEKCSSWQKKLDYYRMDGTVSPESRCSICDQFNEKENKRMRLLLMSTKVGGLGLNLTAANRVIIMTVNWNPSFDTQSVFRVYRFGQEKEVFIYRLISLDTMEEKVYQRTVTKLAVAHRVVDKHQITRHYKSMDLQELYSCRPNADEERPIPNVPEDKVLAKLLLKHSFIFKYHEHQALLANRPEDNLNEQELNAAWDEFKKIKDAPQVPPPLPLPMLPQNSLANGPGYADALALSGLNVPFNGNLPNLVRNRGSGTSILLSKERLAQYYMPNPNMSNKQQKNEGSTLSQMKRNIANTLLGKSEERILNVIEGINSDMMPLPMVDTTNIELDPLYISERSIIAKTKSYMQVLNNIPNLPASTSILIEDDSPMKTNQKENGELARIPKLPNMSIVIEDDEHERNNFKSHKVYIKRKRDSFDHPKKNVLKKMRNNFNTSNSSRLSSPLDKDTEISDKKSESKSFPNEVIQSLGRSGITVLKLPKDSNKNNDVITLD